MPRILMNTNGVETQALFDDRDWRKAQSTYYKSKAAWEIQAGDVLEMGDTVHITTDKTSGKVRTGKAEIPLRGDMQVYHNTVNVITPVGSTHATASSVIEGGKLIITVSVWADTHQTVDVQWSLKGVVHDYY